jgi:hypothetical protein
MRQSREAEYTEYVQARLPWLRRIAYRLTQDWQLADDLTQVPRPAGRRLSRARRCHRGPRWALAALRRALAPLEAWKV